MLKLVHNRSRTNDPDMRLMARVANQDADAYRQLIDKHAAICLRVAERVLGNRDDAEDVVQNVWIKLWRDTPQWEERAKFSTWLYRVVVNASIDHQRVIKRRGGSSDEIEELVDDIPAVDDTLILRERSKIIEQAIQSLPERERVALVLSYYEELNGAEVAEILGMNLGALQVMLHRARKKLQQDLMEL